MGDQKQQTGLLLEADLQQASQEWVIRESRHTCRWEEVQSRQVRKNQEEQTCLLLGVGREQKSQEWVIKERSHTYRWEMVGSSGSKVCCPGTAWQSCFGDA